MSGQSFLLELRTAATKCTNVAYREELRTSANEIGWAFAAVERSMSTEDMSKLVSNWSRAMRVLKNVPPEADPNAPLDGAPEAARLAA